MDNEVVKEPNSAPQEQRVLMTYNCIWGADPELFIANDKGEIVGGERAIPEDGIKQASLWGGLGRKRVVLDGVQVEFNVQQSSCRASLGGDIRLTFQALNDHLKQAKNGMKPSFEAVVRVDPNELKQLSEKARQLGCQPSENIHQRDASVKVTKANENLRSAGGHIHLGLHGEVMKERQRLPFLLDALVGNTCVLIDRNPLAAERRSMYGRAGEYRLPSHGLEYRTLSNFWLRSYQLMSFVMGLSKIACSVLYTTVAKVDKVTDFDYQYNPANGQHEYKALVVDDVPAYNPEDRYRKEKWSVWDAESALLSKLDMEKVARAINTNDLALAKENWAIVKEFIQAHIPPRLDDITQSYAKISKKNRGRADWVLALDRDSVDAFEYFASKVQESGLEYWFPEDPVTHWINLPEAHGIGWEAFLLVDKVVPEMRTKGLWVEKDYEKEKEPVVASPVVAG
jgi:hypothetical protein